MPMYEYECRDCGRKFEWLTFNTKEKVVCRGCESSNVEKMLSVFAVGGQPSVKDRFEAGPCASCGAPERGMCNRD